MAPSPILQFVTFPTSLPGFGWERSLFSLSSTFPLLFALVMLSSQQREEAAGGETGCDQTGMLAHYCQCVGILSLAFRPGTSKPGVKTWAWIKHGGLIKGAVSLVPRNRFI